MKTAIAIRFFLAPVVLLASATTATATSSSENNRKFTVGDLEQVLWGFVEGGLGHEMDLARTCVMDSVGTLEEIAEAIDDIEQETEESVKEGIQLLGQALHEAMTEDFKDCHLAEVDMDTLLSMATTLAHPLSFLYHAGENIVVNRVEISKEVSTAVADWKADPPKYFNFGLTVGKAMKLVLVGAEQELLEIIEQ